MASGGIYILYVGTMEFDALGKNKVEEIFAEIRKWRRVTTASGIRKRYSLPFF